MKTSIETQDIAAFAEYFRFNRNIRHIYLATSVDSIPDFIEDLGNNINFLIVKKAFLVWSIPSKHTPSLQKDIDAVASLFQKGDTQIQHSVSFNKTPYTCGLSLFWVEYEKKEYTGEFKSTPRKVLQLKENEVYVFGINYEKPKSSHLRPLRKWTKSETIKEGPQGQVYGIPYVFNNKQDMNQHFDKFIEYAQSHPEKTFYISKEAFPIHICSNINHSTGLIHVAACLTAVIRNNISNVILPVEYTRYIVELLSKQKQQEMGDDIKKDAVCIGSFDTLRHFYHKYPLETLYGATRIKSVENMSSKVRFVKPDGTFGYDSINKFIFEADQIYWVTNDPAFREHHAKSMYENKAYELLNRLEKLIIPVEFAGIHTNYIDDNGIPVYSGDLVEACYWVTPPHPSRGGAERVKVDNPEDLKNAPRLRAGVGPLYTDHLPAYFSIILDNHCLPLEWCTALKVIGNCFSEENPTGEQRDILGWCNSYAQGGRNISSR